jgi:plasmid stabilization system protein ParE|tara:strand:- start:380 stop:553 length:174 start_codon:yes stop_codon:yes gene_type:complete
MESRGGSVVMEIRQDHHRNQQQEAAAAAVVEVATSVLQPLDHPGIGTTLIRSDEGST